MAKKFKLYDVYEGTELLGKFETKNEVAKACNQRDEETDGECSLMLLTLNEDATKYKIVEDWTDTKTSIKMTV